MLIVLFALFLFVVVLMGGIYFYSRRRVGKDTKRPKQTRIANRRRIIDRANSMLSRHPKDKQGLQMLAGLYLVEEDWDKALKMLGLLVGMEASESKEEQTLENRMNYGICHYQIGQNDKAHQILSALRKLNFEHPNLDYTLGCLEYDRKRYTEAIPLFRRVLVVQPRNVDAQLHLAQSYYQMNQNGEALRLFQDVLRIRKDDSAVLSMIGTLLFEANQLEHAMAIFDRLYRDPNYAARALLLRAMIRMRMHSYEPALEDLNACLKSPALEEETKIDALYQTAQIHIARRNVEALMPILQNIAHLRPNYRDVERLIASYNEMHQNSILRLYLVGNSTQFTELCRQLAIKFFSESTVALHEVDTVMGDHCDILAEVRTATWHDTVLFRFVRSAGLVGELVVRELHEKLREIRAARGVCFTAGTFSRNATIFVEPRAIIAVGKNRLLDLFKRVQPAQPAERTQ